MKNWKRWIGPLLGLLAAFALTFIAGENPLNIARILFHSAFGSLYDFGLTLFYATPLVFTGLSVAIAFRAGLFNIGAEGQLTVGALAATAVGVWASGWGFPWGFLASLTAALIAAGFWGGFAGWLRARRGAHEVIITILMNFIAGGLASWVVLSLMPNPDSQNPESAAIGDGSFLAARDPLAGLFPDTGVSMFLPLAILMAFVVWWIFRRSAWGYEVQAVGQNPESARRAGIPVERRWTQAMLVAGAMAGLVAGSEILGHSGRYKIGFSPDYGFIGIAVALLARNHPLGILASAFFMGALHKGAGDLDLETETITRDFSRIMQALIILGVGLRGWHGWRPKGKG